MNTSALLLKNFARRSALLTKRASPCITTALSRGFSSQQKVEEEVPPEDYYDGHLMADHLEYLDDMIEKTVELKESMEELKQSKLSAIEKASSGVKWIETAEIDRLFEQTSAQKAALGEQLAELKAKMAEARKTYAVDSPDGYSDAWEKEEMEEIKHIIDDAAAHEDKEEVERFHKQQEEAAKTFAVDAPDGETDWHEKEEMDEVKHIIDDAAVLEDPKKIEYTHNMDDKIRKERARDPEHDW